MVHDDKRPKEYIFFFLIYAFLLFKRRKRTWKQKGRVVHYIKTHGRELLSENF